MFKAKGAESECLLTTILFDEPQQDTENPSSDTDTELFGQTDFVPSMAKEASRIKCCQDKTAR